MSKFIFLVRKYVSGADTTSSPALLDNQIV